MPAPTAPDPDRSEVDRRQLRLLRKRFDAISAARLERLRTMLPARHRQFVDLLPLLLHLNHPALPGYVSQGTPCGISGWSPPASTLALAAQLARSFAQPRRKPAQPQIDALYLMGSPGSLGHSDHSDLDIWVCYPHELDAQALSALARKATLLQEWAATLGLEAHLFLMNGERYRSGEREPLTGENCGSTQHHLLLDEFYRTGILLAGRIPAWWLVPPEHEPDHDAWCARLLEQRHVRAGDVIDFGGVAGLGAGEFLSAGIWQLYKAIDSPYKSLLKLLLFEVYASELPRVNSLSADCKRAVCAGVTDIDELDPYLLIYRRIETYLLAREQPKRLEIVRRCLYYKVGKRLSMRPRNGVESWQRRLMTRLVADWEWDGAKLAQLDARRQWNILDVAAERRELVRELRASYRFLADFAHREDGVNPADTLELTALGRRLYAAYEGRSGKIDLVNPGRAIDVSEAEVEISATPADRGTATRWTVWRGSAGHGHALHEGSCLSELLGWCVVNGVIGETTRMVLHENTGALREIEVRAMLRELRDFIASEPAGEASDEAFGQRALITARLVFVNVGEDPLAQAHHADVQRISSRTDSLDYSALRENLVLNLETVSRTSWGELVCARYEGTEGLLRCLDDHLQSAHRGARARLLVRCFCPSRARAIAARLSELFSDLERHFQHERGDCSRYILEIGSRLHLLSLRNGASRIQGSDDLGGLHGLLAEPQPYWSPIAIDRHALARSSLRAIVAHAQPWRCCVFIERAADRVLVTVSDEHGSLWQLQQSSDHEAAVVAALALFLESVHHGAHDGTGTPPAWFRVIRRPGGRHDVETTPAPSTHPVHGCIAMKLTWERGTGATALTLHCDGEAFPGYDPDAPAPERLLALLRQRRAKAAVPICITRLTFIGENHEAPQTVECLRIRTHIEQSLEHAPAE